MDKKHLLAVVTETGKQMKFSVDVSDESFTLEEIITADDGLDVDDINTLQNLGIGEIATFGMGVEVKRTH